LAEEYGAPLALLLCPDIAHKAIEAQRVALVIEAMDLVFSRFVFTPNEHCTARFDPSPPGKPRKPPNGRPSSPPDEPAGRKEAQRALETEMADILNGFWPLTVIHGCSRSVRDSHRREDGREARRRVTLLMQRLT